MDRIAKVVLFMQGVILGLLLFPMIFKFLVQLWECSSRGYFEARTYYEIGRSFIFFAFLGVILVVITPSWMQFVNDFNLHPLLWYCFSINIQVNLMLVFYFIFCFLSNVI